jgi:hypothetical protein
LPSSFSVESEKDDDDDEEDDDDFFISIPLFDRTGLSNSSSSASVSTISSVAARVGTQEEKSEEGHSAAAGTRAPSQQVEEDEEKEEEKVERVVTVYSSSEHNDLTGIAAAQPGYNTAYSASASPSSSASSWGDTAAGVGAGGVPAGLREGAATKQQVERARDTLTELVRCLLDTTGAPGFSTGYDDDSGDGDDHDDDENAHGSAAANDGWLGVDQSTNLPLQLRQLYQSHIRKNQQYLGTVPVVPEYVGFQPGSVPTALLVAASPSLRLQRGQVLREVLRQFELQAVGYDGAAGDDRESGGGHYREVAKVFAFLDGYRTSEVRRLARETASLLLDKLVQEGVEGLDKALASMTRSSDDYRNHHAGELNDSLLEYLNDAIRQQEEKVRRIDSTVFKRVLLQDSDMMPRANGDAVGGGGGENHDSLSDLWTVETTDDGQRVESIDPNDPKVRKALQEEYAKSTGNVEGGWSDDHDRRGMPQEASPRSTSEQLLHLLKLLRMRVEAEAAFAPDEKGRNLRLLAYCLRLNSHDECERLIRKETGNSLDVSSCICIDRLSSRFNAHLGRRANSRLSFSLCFLAQRLDSFVELVASSIEYGESTSHQLQPRKTKPLNVRRLQGILDLCQQMRRKQPR